MKRKELCEKTGLSHKTIRLYEEKGLFSPTKEYRNGREFRKYTQEDVDTLLVVAALRRAWFTMEEIRRMQQEPDAIREIIPQYRAWLLAQKQTLDGLIAATESLPLSECRTAAQLAAQLTSAAKAVPAHQLNLKPRFRYLDDLGESPRQVVHQTNLLEDGGHDLATRMIVSDRSRGGRLFWDNFWDTVHDKSTSTLPDRTNRDSLPMRRWKSVTMAVAVLSGLVLFFQLFKYPVYGSLWRWSLLSCVVFGAVRGALEYVSWKKEQQVWLQDSDRGYPGKEEQHEA